MRGVLKQNTNMPFQVKLYQYDVTLYKKDKKMMQRTFLLAPAKCFNSNKTVVLYFAET